MTPRGLTLGAIQASFADDIGDNLRRAERLIRDAAAEGAQVILPPELFQGPYFCVRQQERWFAEAYPSAS